MKKILIRFTILSLTALVLAVYVLYLLDNLPSIMYAKEVEKTPDNPLRSFFVEETTPELNLTGISEVLSAAQPIETDLSDAADSNIWQAMERSENYNGELQYYSKDNVSFSDDVIMITTQKENLGSGEYTSGMVTSKYAYLYGTFSFQIKVSEGKGLFPAIWLLPNKDKALPEIDIFEMIGSEAQKFYGVVHYSESGVYQREYFCHEVLKKDYYEVGLRWTKNELSWYIDEQCIFITDKGVPDEPMYLIINQAVGGNWAGDPDETTVFPATFIVESFYIEPELIVER